MDYALLALAAATVAGFVVATASGGAIAAWAQLGDDPGGRVGCVDGLRGYLALAVMAYHFAIWINFTKHGVGWDVPPETFIASLGAGPVALFFMTTGLLFHPLIMRGIGGTFWPGFLIGRAFRIVPLIAVSIMLVLVVIALRNGIATEAPFVAPVLEWLVGSNQPDLLGYANSYLVNAGVLWSIYHEWAFYLLLLPSAAVAAELTRGRLPAWMLPAGLFVALFVLTRFKGLQGFGPYLPLFPLGMVVSDLVRRSAVRRLLASPAMTLPAVAALLVAMLAAPDARGLGSMLLYAGFLACVASGNSLFGLLDTPAARALGTCSFGIYVLHGIVLALLFQDAAPLLAGLRATEAMILLPITAALVPMLAAAGHLLVERPAIAAGRRAAAATHGVWTGLGTRVPALGRRAPASASALMGS